MSSIQSNIPNISLNGMPSNQGVAGAGSQTGFKATLSNCLSSILTPKLKPILAGAAIALLAITGIGVGASSVFGFALLGMAYVATALFLTRLGPKESGGNPQQNAINGQAAQNIPVGNGPQPGTASYAQTAQNIPVGNGPQTETAPHVEEPKEGLSNRAWRYANNRALSTRGAGSVDFDLFSADFQEHDLETLFTRYGSVFSTINLNGDDIADEAEPLTRANFTNCTKATTIYLCNNKSLKDVEGLETCESLKELNIEDCESLSEETQKQILSLKNNPLCIHCGGSNLFKKADGTIDQDKVTECLTNKPNIRIFGLRLGPGEEAKPELRKALDQSGLTIADDGEIVQKETPRQTPITAAAYSEGDAAFRANLSEGGQKAFDELYKESQSAQPFYFSGNAVRDAKDETEAKKLLEYFGPKIEILQTKDPDDNAKVQLLNNMETVDGNIIKNVKTLDLNDNSSLKEIQNWDQLQNLESLSLVQAKKIDVKKTIEGMKQATNLTHVNLSESALVDMKSENHIMRGDLIDIFRNRHNLEVTLGEGIANQLDLPPGHSTLVEHGGKHYTISVDDHGIITSINALSPKGLEIYNILQKSEKPITINEDFLMEHMSDLPGQDVMAIAEAVSANVETLDQHVLDNAGAVYGDQFPNMKTLVVNAGATAPFKKLDKMEKLQTLVIKSKTLTNYNAAELKNELLKARNIKNIDIRESLLETLKFEPKELLKLIKNGNGISIPKNENRKAKFINQLFGGKMNGSSSYTYRTDQGNTFEFYVNDQGKLAAKQVTTKPPEPQPQPVGNDGAKPQPQPQPVGNGNKPPEPQPQPQPVGNGNKPPEPQPQPVSEEEQNFYNGLDNDAKNLYQTLSHDGRKIYEALKNEQTGLVILSDFLKKHKDLIDPKNGEMRKIVEALPEKFDNINTDDLLKIGFDASHPIDLSQYTNLEYVTLTDASLVNNLDQAAELNTIYVQPINDEVQGLKDVLLNLKTNNRINIVFKSKIEKFKFTASEIKSILDNGNDLHPYYNSQRNLLDELFGPANGNGDTDKVRIRIGDDNKKYRFYLVYGDLKVEEITE